MTLRFSTVGAVWRPKKGSEISLKYEINIENNFAMAATLVKRSRKMWNVNDDVKRKTNFVKILLWKNYTVILILLQNRVNLIND